MEKQMFRTSATRRSRFAALAFGGFLALTTSFATGQAQSTSPTEPRELLRSIISGWQNGSDTSSFLSPQMAAVVKQQTQDTGIYKEIQGIGTVGNVEILSQQQLPKGTIYFMRAQGQNGYTDWLVGIGSESGRADYITFAVGNNPAPAPFAAPLCYFVGPYLC
jgi:hypothetical protein